MTSPTQELAPKFEAVLMPHDGNLNALARINSAALLPVDVVRTVLVESEKFPYTLLTAANSRPYAQFPVDGALKRFYIFINPESPTDAAQMLALQCTVSVDAKTGIVTALPECLLRGPDADVVMSVKYGCCVKGGRTMIYSDRRVGGAAFLRTAFSGADVRPEMQTLWKGLKLVSLNAAGLAALAHLADDLRGTCGGHAHGHSQRPDYRLGASWGGSRLVVS